MQLLFVGQMDPDTVVFGDYCKVGFDAGESLESIKKRMTEKLLKQNKPWATILLDKVDGTGPFNASPGTFLLSWE